MSATSRLLELAWLFLRLGSQSFGGPIAHLGFFRAEFVERRRWLDDSHYGDLVTLCQFLPGPASSQVVFALGMHRAGLAGALVASVCFTLPSAVLMIAFAYGVSQGALGEGAGWLHGLKLAAVAVVAQAVWGMGRKLCVDRARISLAITAAAVLLVVPGAAVQLAVIGAGAFAGWLLYRGAATPPAGSSQGVRGRLAAALALASFIALLVGLPVLAELSADRRVAVFDAFYRSGSLVFGGGHVVLPLLRSELVPRGWLSDDQFLAGYGAAQALPGPLFAFSAYLGAVMTPGAPDWANGAWCLLAIFLPAWLLVGGALPFWHQLRSKVWAQAALAGANASVVGVLLAALYSPVMTESVRDRTDVALVLGAFLLLEHWKAPPWLIVVGMAVAAHWGRR
ncbi:MAG: chromate efflux transporter [Myxococcaceae bacterium]|nr:chromate efflux transporter [Myxococcaceae bacterium]